MSRSAVALVVGVFLLSSAAPAAAKTPLPGIRTPTRNIRCLFVPGAGGFSGHLLCDIHRAVYTRQLQDHCMATASLDWHGWEVYPARKTEPVCSGGILYNSNTSYPSYKTLPYGRTWRHGVFMCWSRVTGLTCRARTGAGHGIFLSRESWRGW